MKTHEAICEMKKGKIVEALFVEQNKLSKDEFNPIIGFDNQKTMSGFYDRNGDDCDDTLISAISLDVDWKVVDDNEDWNLSNEASIYEGEGEGREYTHQDVEKCRDLILKDIDKTIHKETTCLTETTILDIINKRFGDLK